ncbi:carbonic anhydrase [Pavlovales sp. CCMP2436]|nr:carbonic anhydrase [Pavlovales sp. CCMP2436]
MQDPRSELDGRAYQQRHKQPMVMRTVRAKQSTNGGADVDTGGGGGKRDVSVRGRDVSVRGVDIDGRRVTVASADLARRQELRLLHGDAGMYTSVLTMEEARMLQEERNEDVKASTPREVLDELKAGNARFWTGTVDAPNLSLIERRALIDGQAPKVMVIGCADSRVPIEIVFDQGLGDVFVCRNAGNQCGDTVAGTVDYALNHLGIKLVVVMGHQGCGAVKAARLPIELIMKEPPKLRKLLLDMKDSLAYCSETLDNIMDANARDRESVIANALGQVKKVVAEQNVLEKVTKGDVLVVAAFYEITSGIVDFIELPTLSAFRASSKPLPSIKAA